MASVTVTSDADYTVVVDSGGTAAERGLKVRAQFGGVWETFLTAWEADGYPFECAHGDTFRRAGAVVFNMAGVSGDTAKFTTGAGFPATLIAGIASNGVLTVSNRPIRLSILTAAQVAALSPSEGQVVLEENGTATQVRLAVYLNSAWRYSAYAI